MMAARVCGAIITTAAGMEEGATNSSWHFTRVDNGPDSVAANVQGSSYFLGQRFSACFVLKFALQREEGEKREGVQISKQSTRNL